MSVNDSSDEKFEPLNCRMTHYFAADNIGSDEGIDDPLFAGRLHLDLSDGCDIEGAWPLHASVDGDRTFRTVAELDTLINDLQELRAEWTHLTMPAREGKAEDARVSIYSGYRLEVVRGSDGIEIFIDDTVTPNQSVDQAHEFLYAIAASATAAALAVLSDRRVKE